MTRVRRPWGNLGKTGLRYDTSHPLAVEAGLKMLDAGGGAIDAAVDATVASRSSTVQSSPGRRPAAPQRPGFLGRVTEARIAAPPLPIVEVRLRRAYARASAESGGDGGVLSRLTAAQSVTERRFRPHAAPGRAAVVDPGGFNAR